MCVHDVLEVSSIIEVVLVSMINVNTFQFICYVCISDNETKLFPF
jgi:hypothetical protein